MSCHLKSEVLPTDLHTMPPSPLSTAHVHSFGSVNHHIPRGHKQWGRCGLRYCQLKRGPHGGSQGSSQFISNESPSSMSSQSTHCVILVAPGQETGKPEIHIPVLDSSSTCVTPGRSLHLPEPYFSELLNCYSCLATQQVPATELSAFDAGSHLPL